MIKTIKIKKGLNIKLQGEAEKILSNLIIPDRLALKPSDFYGIRPKLLLHPNDEVKAGTPIFYDKLNEKIKFVAPFAGKIIDIIRGEKRAILEIIIEPYKENSYIDFGIANPLELESEKIKELLLQSGMWPAIRQRPYNIIANPYQKPKSIHISCFDTSPLAPDYDFIVHGKGEAFQTGINAISKLCDGKIFLNVPDNEYVSKVFLNTKNVTITKFSGPHPAGNVGIQIHHIDPINKGDVVWFINPQDIIKIGKLFLTGKYDSTKIIALAGSEVIHPKYFKVIEGTSINKLTENNIKEGKVRYISGNVLTGKKIESTGFLSYYDNLITIIPEYYGPPTLLGWLRPGFKKFSFSKTFLSGFISSKSYKIDTNLNGAKRPFVFTGIYEKVLPMNIYPMQLLKAIITENIELMENLGIYEVAE
ncbi:MAG TPA: Na(+)-translocating NADH-quinone reductase subunit A, partial [Bacteroidales bacterium]|nr:Na(+)-translocating NADH-quinone reductase subunit A [Bacteroidales bacterium]